VGLPRRLVLRLRLVLQPDRADDNGVNLAWVRTGARDPWARAWSAGGCGGMGDHPAHRPESARREGGSDCRSTFS